MELLPPHTCLPREKEGRGAPAGRLCKCEEDTTLLGRLCSDESFVVWTSTHARAWCAGQVRTDSGFPCPCVAPWCPSRRPSLCCHRWVLLVTGTSFPSRQLIHRDGTKRDANSGPQFSAAIQEGLLCPAWYQARHREKNDSTRPLVRGPRGWRLPASF